MEALGKGKEPAEALQSAMDEWEGNDFKRGENKDLYNQVCFEYINPFDQEFEELSRTVFEPLIACEEKIKIE